MNYFPKKVKALLLTSILMSIALIFIITPEINSTFLHQETINNNLPKDITYQPPINNNMTTFNERVQPIIGLTIDETPIFTNDTFTITIYLNSYGIPIGGWNIHEMIYNSSLIFVENVTIGPIWKTGLYSTGTINNSNGMINKIEAALFLDQEAYPSGNMTLCTLTCTAHSNGSDQITITSIKVKDDEFNTITLQIIPKIINIQPNQEINNPPTITISNLQDNDTIIGTYQINGTAHDPDGNITNVQYLIDDEQPWKQAIGKTQWSIELDTTLIPNGNHTLTVRSQDNNQTFSDHEIRFFIIANPLPPAASIVCTTDDNPIMVSDRFTINIFIHQENLIVGGWSINELIFDSSLIQIEEVIPGSYWSENFTNGIIDNSTGIIVDIQTGNTLNYPNEHHLACSLHCAAKNPGNCQITIASINLTDTSFNQVPVDLSSYVLIINENQEPQTPLQAVLNGPYYAAVGETIRLDASASTGNITSYHFQSDKGYIIDTNTSNPEALVHFSRTGYFWIKLTVRNIHTNNEHSIYTSATISNPPCTPRIPYPEDGAQNIDVDTILRWEPCIDPNQAESVSYDVYLTDIVEELNQSFVERVSSASFDPKMLFESKNLNYGTTYFWKITAINSQNVKATGPVWRFNTSNIPPLSISKISGGINGAVIELMNNGNNQQFEINWTVNIRPFNQESIIFEPTTLPIKGILYSIPKQGTNSFSTGKIVGYGYVILDISIEHVPLYQQKAFLAYDHLSIIND